MKTNETNYLILNSLIDLMHRKLLCDIFVKDIAQNANITRQTFYRHFKDKYDVINWYYDQEIESLFVSTLSLHGIHENLVIKFNKYKENLPFIKNAYQCYALNSLTHHEFNRIFDSLSLKIHHNTGLPIEDQPIEIKCALEFYCHGLIHSTIAWLNQTSSLSSQSFADLLIDFIPPEIKSRIKPFD